jgi:SAM-dependent methyltransferase
MNHIDDSASSARHDSNVTILSPGRSIAFEGDWYDVSNPEHFWMQWRFRAFQRQLADLSVDLAEPAQVLEVGGGHGVCRWQMENCSVWSIDLCELNMEALKRCPPSRGKTIFYDIFDRHRDLVGRYDAVILFDVLEHIESSRPFLEAVLAHLRPGGWLFINVPALQSLYSAYDAVLGHYRRYNRHSLIAEFDGMQVECADLRYWGFSMLPLLCARALTMRRIPETEHSRALMARRGFEARGKFVDTLLRTAMRAETRLCPLPPLGTSLLCALRLG